MERRLQIIDDKENDCGSSKCLRSRKRASSIPGCKLEKCASSYYGVFGARIAIMLMLAILIGIITILTWHFTTLYATRSIKSLAYSLRVELLKRTISRAWNLISMTLDATTTMANLSDYIIHGHYLNYADRSHHKHLVMRNITWALFSSRATLKTLTVLYSSGQIQCFDRNFATNKTYYVFSNISIPMQPSTNKSMSTNGTLAWYMEEVDTYTGAAKEEAMHIPAMNFSKYTGNPSNLKKGDAFWHVSVGNTEDESLLSSAASVRHPMNDDVMASVIVTSALSGISSLMRDLARNYSGTLYLTTGDGLLLGSSSNHSSVKMVSQTPRLVPAVEAQDTVIREGARWLQDNYASSIHTEKEVHGEDIVLDSRKFYIDSFYWNLTGLPLIGVILLPRSFVLGHVDEQGHRTLIILISIAMSILVVGCLLILMFTSGVSTEMRLRSELIKHLHARQLAEASSNHKSQFLANMSHELRTPMAAVIGLLDILLSDACLTIEQFNIVSQIRRSSTALLRLLNNILDLSKVESGKVVLEKADFNLRHELEGVVDMFSACVDNHIDIILDLADDMPTLINGDLTRTVQIFANLIGNSVKFTSCTGHIIVRGWSEPLLSSFASSGSKNEDKYLLLFDVEDSGCGIDPSQWETVFDSFVQEDSSTNRTYGGTGLGLCIVRSLVNKMGGKIKIVNKEEQGTLVRFYLLFDPPSDAASSDSTVYNSCVFHNDFKGCKVLIGMKGLRLRSSLINWVSSRGLQVNATDDWNILLEYLQEEKDLKLLVILDTSLLPPDLSMVKDHLSMLSKFKEGGALISWVLNHDTPAEVKMRLREQGYDIMVSKPLYKSKLIKLLKSLVGTSHNQDGILGDRCDTRDTICKGKQPSMDTQTAETRKKMKSNGQGSYAKVVELNLGDKQVVESSIVDIERLKVDSKNIPKSTTVKAQASLAGIRILLAEDTPVIQKVAVILLTKLGATVVAVGDGQAAVDTWRESRQSSEFDLILMDCQMPRMDGYDATKEIRKGEEGSGCHIPIVALTAHAMSSDKRKCLEVGMDAYLTKPIDCKLMASTILSLTHR